ncbi:MAG: type IV pilus modification PilV family protein [Myxococcales bacterium]
MLEGLIAGGVFVIGIVGVLNALIMAAGQNANALKAVRASAIASQIRSSLINIGYDQLVTSPNVLTQACSSDVEVLALAGGLETIDADEAEGREAACVIDLDAVDAPAADYVVVQPGYSEEDRRTFRRILVVFKYEREATETTDYSIGVVVTWRAGGFVRSVNEFVFIPDPDSNESGIEV